VQQILVNQRTGNVVDGHARLEEALARSEPSVPVLYVDLSEAEEALVLATLDPIGAMAESDTAALGALLERVKVDDADLGALLANLGGVESRRPGLVDPDELPVPRDPDVQPGELWSLGEHRLLVGDATSAGDVERLLDGSGIDCVWTDPPYGVAVVGGTEEKLTIRNDDLTAAATRELIAGALRLAPLRPGGVFYVAAPGGPTLLAFLPALEDAAWRLRQTIVWAKDRFVLGHSDFHYRHENVLVGDVGGRDQETFAYGWAAGAAHRFTGGRRLDTLWEIPRPSASRDHPTMKPVEIVARSLEYSTVAGELVYDPFAGSGTTVIAAEQLGRRARVLEIDPRYAQVILDRWQAFTGLVPELLEGPPPA
jgi:DNA modification methylase